MSDKIEKYPFLDLYKSNAPYAEALKEAAARVIDSGRYIGGEEVHSFESELAHYVGARYCIGVSNGLDAIRLIFRACIESGRLHPGDEVIYPANTYIASILPIAELGLIPVAAPPARDDMNLDLQRIENYINPHTRAILLVHLYGSPCWDKEICDTLRQRGLLIIEDNAQAIGAIASAEGFSGSKFTGALGDAAALSFYPTKNLGALGDGGAVLTSDAELAAAVRALANYGSDTRYHNIYRGYNNRLDELQAAFLRIKLQDLENETRSRREIAGAYDSAISNPDVLTPKIFTDRRQVWHQYVIRSPHRDALRDYLSANGIATDIHYAVPPHLQPCFRGAISGDFTYTDSMADTLLSLPIANISGDDALQIAGVINRFRP